MKRILVLMLAAVVLHSSGPAGAAPDSTNQPYFVPNTGGHTSIVPRLVFTPDGKQLISISQDKTIRLWDVERAGPVRVLRPPIGKDREGLLLALALAPDGRTLAVGGAPVGGGRFGHPIYLIDLAGNRIVRSLTGHEGWIFGLAFSPDGKRLASCGHDRTARIWDPATGVCEKTLEGHTDTVADIVWGPDGKRLATASFDRTARLWSAETGRSEKVLKGHQADVRCIAWSPDGKTIATGGKDQALIFWEPDGKLRRKFDNLGNHITSLAFTRTSRSLLFTRGSAEFTDFTATLLTVESGEVRVTYAGHDNSVFAGAISPDGGLVATAGGAGHEIHLWTIPEGKPVARLSGLARAFFGAGWGPDGDSIAWGAGRPTDPLKAAHPLDRSFRLANLEFGEPSGVGAGAPGGPGPHPPGDPAATRARTERGGLSLAPLGSGAVAVRMGDRTLNTLRLLNRDRLRCFTFLDADRVAVGSTNSLDLFDVPTGQRLRSLVSHTDEVWAIAPAPHRRWLLSASPDQTLRLWDTEAPLLREVVGAGLRFKLEEGVPVITALEPGAAGASVSRLRVGDRLVAAVPAGKDEFVELKGRKAEEVHSALEGPADSVLRLKVLPEGKDEVVEYVLQRTASGPGRSEPFVSLFVSGNDWAAWTPEGYYAASPGGEKVMGWHVNNGLNQLAFFYPAERFAAALYRPDIISRLAETGNVDRAVALADLVRGKKTERVVIADVLPPRVRIISPEKASLDLNEDTVEVSAEARMTGAHPIRALRLLVDGRPFKGLEGARRFDAPGLKEAKASWKVKLSPGRHRLIVQADSAVSQGESDSVEVNYVIGTPPQGRLFVLAIGISEYEDDNLRLFYSAKDAKAIADRLKEKGQPAPYQEIEVRVLTDKDALRKNILQELQTLHKRMKPEDSAWVFYSGHGERDRQGQLYLLPVDADLEKLKVTGISGDDLKTALVNLPGRVLLVLDACHSGAGAKRPAIVSVSDDLARELGRDENGVIVMCSSMARQKSLEDNENRQSAFTLALLEGLGGKGNKGLDGVVYQHNLDSYVIDRVRQLTKGRQTPTTAKPGNLPLFPLTKP